MQEEEQVTTIPEMVDQLRAGKMPRRKFMKTLTAMGLSAAGVGAVVAAAASRSFATHPVTRLDENVTKNLHLHDQHLAHQQTGNTDALHHDYAPHAVVEDSMHPHPFVGQEAIISRKKVGIASIPDLNIQVTNRLAHDNQVTVEWIATGTHSGDFPGFPATGRTFAIRGVTVVVRHDGKIVRESLYYDMAELARQLGPK